MSDWLILGAGGHARVVHDVIVRLGHQVLAVAGQVRGTAWDLPVLGDDDEALALAARTGAAVAVAVGDDLLRLGLLRRVVASGLSAPPIVATTATVAPSAALGPGTVVLEHAHVGPAAVVGDAVVVNTAAVVEHDATSATAATSPPVPSSWAARAWGRPRCSGRAPGCCPASAWVAE